MYPPPRAASGVHAGSTIADLRVADLPVNDGVGNARAASRWLSRKGLVVGSSSDAEFEPQMPEYTLRPAHVQCRLGQREVGRVFQNMRRRGNAAAQYRVELPQLGLP